MKASIDYSIVQVTEIALQHSIRLAESHFPVGHPCRNVDYLNWLYLENPMGNATLVVATSSDRWVGMLALVPVTLRRGGESRKACFCVNVLSHPDYRGNNIFINLIKIAKEFLSAKGVWLLGHPNRAAFPGWKRQKMAFRRQLEPVYLLPRGFGGGYKKKIVSSPDSLKELPWLEWSEVCGSDGGVRIEYSAEFVDWRYLRSVVKDYKVHSVEGGDGKPAGVFVTRNIKFGIQLVVDWIGSCEMAIGSLLQPRLALLPSMKSGEIDLGVRGVRIPTQRSVPFFVSTWEEVVSDRELCSITLGASDL